MFAEARVIHESDDDDHLVCLDSPGTLQSVLVLLAWILTKPMLAFSF